MGEVVLDRGLRLDNLLLPMLPSLVIVGPSQEVLLLSLRYMVHHHVPLTAETEAIKWIDKSSQLQGT